jgi:hypothetical protein
MSRNSLRKSIQTGSEPRQPAGAWAQSSPVAELNATRVRREGETRAIGLARLQLGRRAKRGPPTRKRSAGSSYLAFSASPVTFEEAEITE